MIKQYFYSLSDCFQLSKSVTKITWLFSRIKWNLEGHLTLLKVKSLQSTNTMLFWKSHDHFYDWKTFLNIMWMFSTTKLPYKDHVSIFKRQIECSYSYGPLKVKIVSLQFLMVKIIYKGQVRWLVSKKCVVLKWFRSAKCAKQKDETNWSPIYNNACV